MYNIFYELYFLFVFTRYAALSGTEQERQNDVFGIWFLQKKQRGKYFFVSLLIFSAHQCMIWNMRDLFFIEPVFVDRCNSRFNDIERNFHVQFERKTETALRHIKSFDALADMIFNIFL